MDNRASLETKEEKRKSDPSEEPDLSDLVSNEESQAEWNKFVAEVEGNQQEIMKDHIAYTSALLKYSELKKTLEELKEQLVVLEEGYEKKLRMWETQIDSIAEIVDDDSHLAASLLTLQKPRAQAEANRIYFLTHPRLSYLETAKQNLLRVRNAAEMMRENFLDAEDLSQEKKEEEKNANVETGIAPTNYYGSFWGAVALCARKIPGIRVSSLEVVEEKKISPP
jgi:hypothetical protein